MTALLEIEKLTAGYSSDIDVLREVSLEVAAGSIRGLIGLNGAGKSTVMKTVAGFLKPKAGQVRYDGDDITGIASHDLLAREIYMIPQESSLFPYMSVRDNLLIPLQRRNQLRTDRPIPETAALDEALEIFPILREKMNARAGSLSGGQQKQLEFAKAYILKPRLCMIDEPSIGLAPAIANQVFDWIRLFAKAGMAVLLVDHNIRRVIQLSDYTYVLSLGSVTAEGPRETFEGDMHDQVREWLGLNY